MTGGKDREDIGMIRGCKSQRNLHVAFCTKIWAIDMTMDSGVMGYRGNTNYREGVEERTEKILG